MVVWSASRPRSQSSSSTSRNESEYRRYQRTAHRISSGSVCRHLKIAGRIACFTMSSGYQPPPALVATHPFRRVRGYREMPALIEALRQRVATDETKEDRQVA